MKKSMTFALASIAFALTVGLFSCGGTDPAAFEDEEISIGVVVALTGQHAEPYGFPMQRGFEMAREEINSLGGVNLTFITVDDRSSAEGAKEAVQSLVDQGVPAIVGLAISTHLKEAAPIAQENQVIAFSSVSSAAGLSGIGNFIFRASLATNISIPSGVTATKEIIGYQKVATIYDEIDVYARSSNDVLNTVLEENGVEILIQETFKTGDTDFSQQLTNIMAVEPDALFISALAQEIALIVGQTADVGFPDAIRVISPDLTMDEVQKAGEGAEGTIGFIGWSLTSDAPGNQAFVENYRAKYGLDPEPWAAQSYATLYILANAIKTAQSADSTAIRDALAQTKDLPTILGDFSFNPDGDALYDQIVLIVKDGEFQVFE